MLIAVDITRSLSDLAQILAGIQVPPSECDEFEDFLKNLGYSYVEETDNVVYKKYLRQ